MELTPELSYIINSFFLFFCGALVMLMAAGFAMLEAGSVRSKSVAVILVKNISLYAIASMTYLFVGYNLMYTDVSAHDGLFGSPLPWHYDDTASAQGDFSAGHSSESDWFFQMVFVATTVSIVSGALAERIKLIPFFIFTIILSGLCYPITGSWVWGQGWLSELGFSDFAGSTLVHSVGGWAALAGAILLGARKDRFCEKGSPKELEGSSMPLVTLGTFILWFGWFGFNGGSQLAIASVEDVNAVGKIFANTNTAAAAGTVAMVIFGIITHGRINVALVMNGALAGLVAITADPLSPSIIASVAIGACGSVIMLGATILLEKLKIDDVVGAVPVHLAAGIFGTLIVAVSNPEATFINQLIGVAAIGAFTFTASLIAWGILKMLKGGIRLHWSEEDIGGDMAELGIKAYNI